MIRRETRNGVVDLTFSLDHPGPVAVVGEFNGWDPGAHPMAKRSNGRRSVKISLPPGRYAFRYSAGAAWFDDEDADVIEANGLGETHGVLLLV